MKEREGQITNLLILLNATAKEDSISVDYDDDDDLSQGVTNSMKSKSKRIWEQNKLAKLGRYVS